MTPTAPMDSAEALGNFILSIVHDDDLTLDEKREKIIAALDLMPEDAHAGEDADEDAADESNPYADGPQQTQESRRRIRGLVKQLFSAELPAAARPQIDRFYDRFPEARQQRELFRESVAPGARDDDGEPVIYVECYTP